MIKSTLRELMQGKLDNVDLSGVYLIRDKEHVLYVGRSIDVIERLQQHATSYVSSLIADLIHLNRPQSWDWQIELREPHECGEFVKLLYPDYKDTEITIELAEQSMIFHYHPHANRSNNPNRSKKPVHIKDTNDLFPLEVGQTDNLY